MANEYKIELGVELNTSGLKDDINKLDNKYKLKLKADLDTTGLREKIDNIKIGDKHKLKLGVHVTTEDIRKQISAYNNNTNNAKLKLGVKLDDTDIKRQLGSIKGLNGKDKDGVSIPLNTQSLEASLDRVAIAVEDIRNAIGTIDDKSDMKPLLSSINQITTALGRASDESETLVRSLSALGGKDFNLNFGINLGKANNPIARNVAYGNKARGETIPQLKQQVNDLVKYYNDVHKTTFNEFEVLTKLASGTKLNTGDLYQNLFFGDNSLASKMSSTTLSTQMQGFREFINLFKEAANLKGFDISSVVSSWSKSADELVKDTQDVQTGINEATDGFEKFKGIFGGIDTESLKQILADLGKIRESIDNLAKNNSIDGLTASFEKLSNTLDRLMLNANLIQNAFGNLSANNIDNKVDIADKTIGADKAVQSAQQVGKAIGNSIEESVEQSINLDDVIDKEVIDLMDKFSIAGEKGSKAFNEIRQAVVECRTELNVLKNGDIGIDEEVFDTSAAVDKVTTALANQMRVANDLGDEYVELANYMTRFNDPSKGNKVRLPDVVRQEQGDDYRSNRGSLGIAFNANEGISFVDFVNDLNHELGQTIDLTNGEAAAMDELLRKVELGRQQRDALNKTEKYRASTASTEEILEQNGIDRNEIYDDVMSIVNVVDTAEQQIAQSSAQATNVVIQNEERKQQAYRETANVINNRSQRLISDSVQEAIDNVSSKNIDKYFKVDKSNSDDFRREMNNLVEQWTGGKGNLVDLKIDTRTVYDKDAQANIERLHQAQVTYNNELGETIKKTIAWRQIGTKTDKDGNEVAIRGFVEVAGQYSKTIGKTAAQTSKFIKQQKQDAANLTNQINQISRAAYDQNASRPIKESSHLDTLKTKQEEIISSIERMKNASDSNTFQEEKINVKNLISEYKSLVSEYKNAENVSTKMKGTDYKSGLEIAKNDLEKFKANAKDYPQIIDTINNLDKAIANVGDTSSLNEFNDQLRIARSELAKVKAETIATNRKEKVGIDVSTATSKIANMQRISPEINEFKTVIDGAEVSVESLLNDLSKVNTAGDFSVVNKRVNAFEKAAEAAGIAVKELSASQEANNVYNQIYNTKKRIGSLEVDLIKAEDINDVKAIRSEIERLETKLSTLDVDGTYSSKFTNKQKASLEELDKQTEYNKKLAENKVEVKLENESIKETEDGFKRLKALAKELGQADIKIAELEADGQIEEANRLRRTMSDAEEAYNSLYAAINKDLSSSQIKELDQIFTNTTGSIHEFKDALNKSAEASGLTSGLERLKSIAREINGIKLDLFKFEDADNIERASTRLNELETEAAELRLQLQQKFNFNSFEEIDDIARKGEQALNDLIAKAEEVKAKLAKNININIELGNYDDDLSRLYDRFIKLRDAPAGLEEALRETEQALDRLNKAANADTGDVIADRENLIQAEKEYHVALEKTSNLINKQAREEKAKINIERLEDDRELFQSKIDAWLNENSAATQKFGERLRELRAAAEYADKTELAHLEKELKKVDREAEKAGLKMQSLGDRIKTKFKEYAAYFSVAEMFMYAEQALRSMFEQVKLIDSAMTELKKVTNESDAAYNNFLTNAASKAKEIGTTIDGFINSTADFARLGYSFADSQGLAAVANIYAVVGDEIDGVEQATESLISTLAAFKDEANGMSDADFAMSIIDKFNEIGELIA